MSQRHVSKSNKNGSRHRVSIQEEKLSTATATASRNVDNNDKSKTTKKKIIPFRQTILLEKPPSARDAAFVGPPRYDWIDIVS